MKFCCRERLRESLAEFFCGRGLRDCLGLAGRAVTRDREKVFFNIIGPSERYSGALCIRLHCSILLFRGLYRKSAVGPFL